MDDRSVPGGAASTDSGLVSRYEPQRDRAALLEFRRDHYGPDAARAQPAYIDWQYRDAPQVAGQGSPLHLARKDGRVVGTMGTIRTSLLVKGQRWPVAWAVDFAVRKELRRSGIGEAIAVASRAAEPVTRLVIDASVAAERIVLRGGYRPVAEVPLYVRPIDPRRWLRARGMPAALARLSSAMLPAFAVLDSRSLAFARKERIELLETTAFDERADALFAAVSPSYAVLCQRDRSWLEWRFDRCPEPTRYQRCWLMRRGGVVGYAVLRAGTHHGAPAGILVDYLCAPALIPALLALCLQRFRAAGAAVATCLHLNVSAATAFRSLGFFQRKSSWHFLVRPRSLADPAAILEASNWFITAGDGNVDRDRIEVAETASPPTPQS